mmetsp:Transcript_33355/g.71468  ORF Transcript_33355/g.71468 Transcript_33355/m.71468 type:complete len:422 (+) Transcript_33355:153-1418(+)
MTTKQDDHALPKSIGEGEGLRQRGHQTTACEGGQQQQQAKQDKEKDSEATGEGDHGGDIQEPEALLCPVTQIMYQDPVFVPESGNTYERSAVEQYWRSAPPPRDPLTNVALADTSLHPNWMVRREVQRFLDEHPSYTPQGWTSREVPRLTTNGLAAAASHGYGRAILIGIGVFSLCLTLSVLLPLGVGQADVLTSFLPGAMVSKNPPPLRASKGEAIRSPRGSPLIVAHVDVEAAAGQQPEGKWLVAELPRSGFSGESIPQLFFAAFWLVFTGCWTYGAVSGGAPVMFASFSLPFWGVGVYMLWESLREALVGEILEVGQTTYRTCSTLFKWDHCVDYASFEDLAGPPIRQCTADSCKLIFEEEGARYNYEFGRSLADNEAKWLQGMILKHLPTNFPEAEESRPKRVVEVQNDLEYDDYGI